MAKKRVHYRGPRTLKDLWGPFAQAACPAEASPQQVIEMRKAFYSGAMAMMKMVEAISTTLPDDEAFAVLERLEREYRAFLDVEMVRFEAQMRQRGEGGS